MTKALWARLEGTKVVPVERLDDAFMDAAARTVAFTVVGKAEVSTVFLGLNHGRGERDMWFETMIFGGEHDQWQRRYETWDEAAKGHRDAALALKEGRCPE